MSFEQSLAAMLRDPLAHLGYAIVCVRVQGTVKKIVEILIERHDGAPITIADCVAANREAAAILEVENPIHGAYVLQASSPGLDRPLLSLDDFKRFTGKKAKVELHALIAGQRRFVGEITGVEAEMILLKVETDATEEVLSFSFNDIQKAKLVPTFENLK